MLPDLKARQRKPSHLGSYCHGPPLSGSCSEERRSEPPLGVCPKEAASQNRFLLQRSARRDGCEVFSLTTPRRSLSCRKPCLAEQLDSLLQWSFGVAVIRPCSALADQGWDGANGEPLGIEVRLHLCPGQRHRYRCAGTCARLRRPSIACTLDL
jgi:hypothetical protein